MVRTIRCTTASCGGAGSTSSSDLLGARRAGPAHDSATHLQAHRTAANLLRRSYFPPCRSPEEPAPDLIRWRPELQAARSLRWPGSSRRLPALGRPTERPQGGPPRPLHPACGFQPGPATIPSDAGEYIMSDRDWSARPRSRRRARSVAPVPPSRSRAARFAQVARLRLCSDSPSRLLTVLAPGPGTPHELFLQRAQPGAQRNSRGAVPSVQRLPT